tara:strand:- start:883 stop:1860 length:978 start_codon:yes stop_codon:yes gene_type:complete
MTLRLFLFFLSITFCHGEFYKKIQLSDECNIHFASTSKAKELLAKKDIYIQGLSSFERAAKIKQAGPISIDEYIKFIQEQTVEWSKEDKIKLSKVIAKAKIKLGHLANHLPKNITFIKTTGQDEGGAPYTRGNSIILPKRQVSQSIKSLERLFYHELFHIISRNNKQLRDELYSIIGFKPCGVVKLPDDMMPLRISNPDAPIIEHCIRISFEDKKHWVAPVLFSRIPKYNPETGDIFFRYLEFRLMPIDLKTTKPILNNDKPILLKPNEVEGFFEQIGRNTSYILHPEETLANNFVLLTTGKADLKNPEIPKKIKLVFEKTNSKN